MMGSSNQRLTSDALVTAHSHRRSQKPCRKAASNPRKSRARQWSGYEDLKPGFERARLQLDKGLEQKAHKVLHDRKQLGKQMGQSLGQALGRVRGQTRSPFMSIQRFGAARSSIFGIVDTYPIAVRFSDV